VQEWSKWRLVKVCYCVASDFEMTDSFAWVLPTVLILFQFENCQINSSWLQFWRPHDYHVALFIL
jgi:hypothetical protein